MNSRDLLSGRIGALAGVAFSILLFFSVAMVNLPHAATDDALVAWWSDDGNVTTMLASTYMQIAAGICFLVFISTLRTASARSEGGTGTLTSFAFTAGVVFTALLLASDGTRGAIAIPLKLRDETLPDPSVLRYLPQVNYVMLGAAGGVVVSAAMTATSILVLRTRAFGRWLGILGLICAAIVTVMALIVGPFYLPVLFVWVLATSVALWLGPSAATVNAPAAAMSAAAR